LVNVANNDKDDDDNNKDIRKDVRTPLHLSLYKKVGAAPSDRRLNSAIAGVVTKATHGNLPVIDRP